jgi:predicted ATP-grasp superfamily ATP-dependent carboligase
VKRTRILITDGEQRSALAAARSLGRAGYDVHVASHKRASLAGASKYVRSAVEVPNPLARPAEFVGAVRTAVVELQIDVLIPVTEAALLALLPARESIPATLPFPSAAAFGRLCDKALVAREAHRLGIEVPRTLEVGSKRPEDLGVIADLVYPVVVKPHRSVGVESGGRVKLEVRSVANHASLMAELNALPENAYPVLLQQQVVGDGVGIFVLMHRGEVHAAFAHRRIREKPPWGGVSVLRESIALDPQLLALSVELLRVFELEGAAMVEYKLDAATGTPYIMEINGRFWGSLQLAIDAGVDFPALMVAAILGEAAPRMPAYREGTRSRWFWGDVDNLLLRLRNRGPAKEAHRARAVFEFIRSFGPRSRSEIFRLADPAPAVRETIDWFRALRRTKEETADAAVLTELWAHSNTN